MQEVKIKGTDAVQCKCKMLKKKIKQKRREKTWLCISSGNLWKNHKEMQQ